MSNTMNKKPEGLALPEGARSGPNCGVTAMAIAANISFDSAWDLLERVHRDRRGGLLSNIKTKNNMFSKKTKFTGATFDADRELAYKKLGLKTTKINFKDRYDIAKKKGNFVLTLKNFVEWGTVKGKTYIVTTTRHVQVVKDNWVIDQGGAKPIDEFHGKSKHVDSIHEVGKLKTARSDSKYSGMCLYAMSKGNHRRQGSFGYHSMQIIIENNGISYEDYISKGGRTRDLDWDLDKCHVEILRKG